MHSGDSKERAAMKRSHIAAARLKVALAKGRGDEVESWVLQLAETPIDSIPRESSFSDAPWGSGNGPGSAPQSPDLRAAIYDAFHVSDIFKNRRLVPQPPFIKDEEYVETVNGVSIPSRRSVLQPLDTENAVGTYPTEDR
jgi:hypothetical protein